MTCLKNSEFVDVYLCRFSIRILFLRSGKLIVNSGEKEVAEKLESMLMESHPGRGKESAVGPGPELDSEVKKRLEDLGYY